MKVAELRGSEALPEELSIQKLEQGEDADTSSAEVEWNMDRMAMRPKTI